MTATIPTRKLGKTDLQVPILGIGTGSFSGLYNEIPESGAIQTMHYALDRGLNLIDTAPWYGAFVAEGYVGNALKTRERSSYVLSTKIGLWSENGEAVRGYSRDKVLWSLEGSLKRLQLDRVDIIHIHDLTPEHYRTIVEEGYPTLVEVKQQGITKAISVGTGDWEIATQLARDVDLDLVMLAGRYTLLEQPALTAINELYSRDIPVFSAGIYNSGVLATGSATRPKYNYGDAPAPILERVRQLEAVCQRHGVSLKAAAAQFVRTHPAITTILLGVESPEHIAENIAVFDEPIPPDFWQDIRQSGLVDERAPLPA